MTETDSHSLFQGKYFGSRVVDGRCSKALLAWVIEECLLNEHDHKSIWFSPASSKLSVVEDDGTELMDNDFSEITHFIVLKDERSFGYLVRSSFTKFKLHAFQALEKADVAMVEKSIRGVVVNGNQRLRSVSPSEAIGYNSDSSGNDLTSSVDSLKSSWADVGNINSEALSTQNALTFSLNYLGMISTLSKSLSPGELDKLLDKMKEHTVEKHKEELLTASDRVSVNIEVAPVTKSPKQKGKKKMKGDIGPTISIVSVEEGARKNRAGSFNEQRKETKTKKHKKHSLDGTLSAGQSLLIGEEQSKQNGQHSGVVDLPTVSVDNDVVDSLSSSVELPSRNVILKLTSEAITLQDPSDNKIIRKKKVAEIASCTQGSLWREYIGFVCKEESMQSRLFCHMLKADDSKLAGRVVSAFRTTFSAALAINLPSTLSDSSPLSQLNSLCQSVEGASVEATQSKIDGVLAALNDSHSSKILTEYNSRKPQLGEHQQLVLMISLLRKCFEALQSTHDHHHDDIKDSANGGTSRRFLPIGKARHVLASSFESLKPKNKKASKDKSRIKVVQGGSHSVGSSPVLPRKQYNLSPSPESFSPLLQNALSLPLRIATKPSLTTTETQSPLSKASNQILATGVRDKNNDIQSNTLPRYRKSRHYATTKPSDRFPPLNRINIRSLQSKSQSPSRNDSHHAGDLLGDIPVISPSPSAIKPPFVRGHRRGSSWIQQIYESVTPGYDVKPSLAATIAQSPSFATRGSLASVSSEEEPGLLAKKRWRRAIEHQITVLRMRNNKIKADDEVRRMKLAYPDTSIDGRKSVLMWSELLSKKMQKQDIMFTELRQAVQQGIRPAMRPAAWQLMVDHYASRQKKHRTTISVEHYSKLCTTDTDYHHAISIDLGRTFPSYAYFSLATQLGQDSLERLLHAYAVKDCEVGYCQGLSFVAGMILIHTRSDNEAFDLLSDYMNTYHGRPAYQADMFGLQVALYQFSRLLHDMNPEIYNHMEEHDVTPFMYAAPWLLTLFASQFPIAFVARIMDLLFLEGIEAMFKTAIALLTLHQDLILNCRGMEDTVEYIKIDMPAKALDNVQEIIDAVLTCDTNVGLKLQHYEVEYRVMHELALAGPDDVSLRKQNQDLIEHVAICKGSIAKMETEIAMLQEELAVKAKAEAEDKALIQELVVARTKMEAEMATMREGMSVIPTLQATLKTLQEQVIKLTTGNDN